MKKTALTAIILTVFCLALVSRHASGQDIAYKSESLSSAMAKQIAPEERALGVWNYTLKAGDESLGKMSIAVESAKAVTGDIYRITQTAEFKVPDGGVQKFTLTLRMKPDLSLIDYEKKTETIKDGKTVAAERVFMTSGAMTISVEKDTGSGPVKSVIKKEGPVCYAFGAAWVAALSLELRQGRRLEFKNVLPTTEKTAKARIDMVGPVTIKTPGGSVNYFRISAFNGESEMVFHIDGNGRIAEFGPSTGEMMFVLAGK